MAELEQLHFETKRFFQSLLMENGFSILQHNHFLTSEVKPTQGE